jgi:hypothetical protein
MFPDPLSIDWIAKGSLSSFGTMGHIAASFTNPTGFSLENFRIKVFSFLSPEVRTDSHSRRMVESFLKHH